MNTPFWISLRYQQTKQKNRLVALISRFSTIGIALGVAVLVIGFSAMNGFERELNQRILAVVPHGNIYPTYDKTLENLPKLTALLQQNRQITGITPYVTFTGLVENGSKLKVVQVKGVTKSAQDQTSRLGQFVLDNAWQQFEQREGLILGAKIAESLDVRVGDWVSLLISQTQQDSASQPERERVQITGILRLDGQLDHSYALMPLALAQKLQGYQADQVNGVEFSYQAPFQIQNADYSMLHHYPQSLQLKTWIGQFGYMYRDIQLIRTVMYIAMVLVIGVACFNIVSTLIMAVKDKQGDIAIMRTLGANNRFIKRIFIWYGLLAGMKGCLIGLLLGSFIALNLTALIRGVENVLGKKLLSDGIYFIDFLPSELHFLDLLFVFGAALILSLLASLYPASRAAKLQPAQVLSGH